MLTKLEIFVDFVFFSRLGFSFPFFRLSSSHCGACRGASLLLRLRVKKKGKMEIWLGDLLGLWVSHFDIIAYGTAEVRRLMKGDK